MAREKKPEPLPDDIPAWFMTYSDVITLLMTFFILLLTFSTTEPERFEKVQSSVHESAGATGIVGEKIDGLTKDSWVTRVRPPAARIATRGSEMPPLTYKPVKTTFGAGLKSLGSDEKNHNEATSHYFDVEITKLFDAGGQLSPDGKQICKMLSAQLADLPFHASIQFTDKRNAQKLVNLLVYLFEEQQTRPGQVALSLAQPVDLGPDKVRFMITRFLGNGS